VCPAELIKLEGEACPEEIADADERCISCGHCVAACPEGALSNTRITGCLSFNQDLKVKAETLTQFLKTRRSIRVSRVSHLERLVHAWDQGRDPILRNAPHVIVAHASPDNIWSPTGSAIAVTHLELAAQADGLGTCWSGIPCAQPDTTGESWNTWDCYLKTKFSRRS
jgi:Fe-S-cluster-containing hydrogenase component 2